MIHKLCGEIMMIDNWSGKYYCDFCRLQRVQKKGFDEGKLKGIEQGKKDEREYLQIRLSIAMEWGFKAHEKGINFEKARFEFNELLKGL
jgi:hypothetical protein